MICNIMIKMSPKFPHPNPAALLLEAPVKPGSSHLCKKNEKIWSISLLIRWVGVVKLKRKNTWLDFKNMQYDYY